jgi:ankyrin repeat protein
MPSLIFIYFRSLHIAARNKQNFALKTLLTAIIDHEPPDRQNAILNARNKRGQTALHSAIRASDADAVHYLITAGAQRSILDYDGNSVIIMGHV